MNLVSNAADAVEEHQTEGKKEILINAQVDGDNLVSLTVEDSGPGIPAESREKILETFYTTKEVGKGTGLGMSIVLRILELHQLKLAIEDSTELGGAKMVITQDST
jgi:signal transduction histidine kinase